MPFRKARRVFKKKPLLASAPKRSLKAAVNTAKVRNLKRIVKSVMHKQQETKMVMNTTVADAVNIPGAGLTSGGLGVVSAVVPVISQGVTESARIGNKVRVVSLKLRYSLNALPSTVAGGLNPFDSLPFFVKVVVYRHRYNLGDSSPDALVDTGATNTNFSNAVDTYFRSYNKDEYIIAYSKIHKLQPAKQLTATGFLNNSIDPRFTSFLIRTANIKLPKYLIFNDTNTTPTNAGWWVGFAVCNADGSAITGSQTRCTVNAESRLYFQDD